jgi:hypothetical protein
MGRPVIRPCVQNANVIGDFLVLTAIYGIGVNITRCVFLGSRTAGIASASRRAVLGVSADSAVPFVLFDETSVIYRDRLSMLYFLTDLADMRL